MARIDRRHHVRRVVLSDQRGGERHQRGQADRRFSGGKRDAARGRDANAQPGKAAGAGGDGDAVEVGEIDLGQIHHPRKQRHDGLGVPTRHRNALARGDAAAVGVEYRGRAGFERSVDGKDAHGSTLAANIRVGGRRSRHRNPGFRCCGYWPHLAFEGAMRVMPSA